MNAMPDSSTFATTSAPRLVWIVVVSKLGQEVRAKRELLQQGFEVYLPMKLSQNKKRELISSPFFRRYLFARVPADVSEWREIFSTYGVAGVLGFSAGRAYGLKDVAIDELRGREEGGYIKIGLAEEPKPFEHGQRVVTEDGVEGIFDAVLNESDDNKRAAFLVNCMGRQTRFTVDLRQLRSVG